MRQVSASLAAAIEAAERTTRVRLSVDFDGDGHSRGSVDDLSGAAASVVVESQLKTVLPEQVAVVEGTAAATLSADLVAGDTDDERLAAVQYFSPTQTASPLYGKRRLARDVQCDVEFLTADGWQSAPLLRGTVRAMPASVAGRRVTLAAIDYRTQLRTPVQLPVIIANAPPYTGFLTEPSKPGLEGTWVVSYVLWQCGMPLSPPPADGCRLWIPLHGSGMPFIQADFTATPIAYRRDTVTDERTAMDFAAGPHVLGTAATSSVESYQIIAPFADGPQIFAATGRSAVRFSLWVKADGTRNASVYVSAQGNLAAVQFSYNLSGLDELRIVLWNGTIDTHFGPSVPADGQWHYIGVHVDDAGGRAVFRVDATSTVVTFTPSGAQSGIVDEVEVQFDFGGQMADLQVTAGLAEADAWADLAYAPAAVVDRSQLRLDGIAASDPAEGWVILQELAAAEQGASYFSAGGTYHYASRARLCTSAAQIPQRVVDADRHIFDLAYNYETDQVRNVISCPYQPVAVTMRGTVWSLAETVMLDAGGSRTFQIAASFATSFDDVDGFANTASDGSGTQQFVSPFNAVNAVLTRVSATAATLVVTNNSGARVWLVDTSGSPALSVIGDAVAQGTGANTPSFTNTASVDIYGEQPLDVASNRWVQTRAQAAGLAMVTGLDLGEPRPVIADLSIPGDPRLEYYDRITVTDPDNTGLDLDVWYLGGRHHVDAAGGYTQSVTGRATRDRYLVGVGLVGEDLVG